MPRIEDASGFWGEADEIFTPGSAEDVREILQRANAGGIPITVSGAGTGLTGGRVAQSGWVILLDRFRAMDIGEGYAVAGAGVGLHELQAAAARRHQFYAPDPTEQTASVGGSIATNASGSRSFRYGSTRRHVLGLTVAFVDGRIASFERGEAIDFPVPDIPLSPANKNTAGYQLRPNMDWVDLFVGSEGTLAIVLEARLRLLPAPDELLSGVIFFSGDEECLDAVDELQALPQFRMIEYFDARSLTLLRSKYSEVPAHARAAVLIEQEGMDTETWEHLAAEDGWFAFSDADRERFRQFRHALPEMVNDIMRRRGFLKLGSDYAVPVDRSREMLRFYHDRLSGLDYVIFGHIGDAHVHVNILPQSEQEFAAGKDLMLEFARKAVELRGTVSAEHGLGKRKAHLLSLQYSEEQIEAMKAVKRRLDPKWLLGRGNLFPAE